MEKPIDIVPINKIIPAELCTPTLNALIPNEDNYSVLLMQPHGNIQVSDSGVQNQDRSLANSQFGKLLEDAIKSHADLVITPEYSMPWDTLVQAIKSGTIPEQGKLWALGCESIRIEDLETLKQDIDSFATVIFEQLQSEPERFISPLAYVFVAPPSSDNGEAKTVILVQFKTLSMGDPKHFEINGMQRGTRIYQFGGMPMSFIHTDDIHLGITYRNSPGEAERYEDIFCCLSGIEKDALNEKVDFVLICGDLFHTGQVLPKIFAKTILQPFS